MSGVSRFKICTFELGSGSLSADEQEQILKALHAEADRLRNVPAQIELCLPGSPAECASTNQARGKRSTEQS